MSLYEEIDYKKLEELEAKHSWIVDPIYKASTYVKNMPFYDWIENLDDVKSFKDAGCQLYYHSDTFPKVMGLMLALTPLEETSMMPFYAKHAYGEADHSQMLLNWMIKHNLVENYQQDREKWLVGLNSGIERCSNDFFKAIAPKMHKLGAGDEYFDVHVEADEHHSIMGLDYIEQYDTNSIRGKILVAKALEGIELWASMIHSWIGISTYPKFNLKGEIIKDVKC